MCTLLVLAAIGYAVWRFRVQLLALLRKEKK